MAFCLRFKISLLPFFSPLLEDLISPRLISAPFLGAPMRRSASSSTHCGSAWLGTGPRALPDPVAVPGELAHPSSGSSRGLAIRRIGTPVWKRTRNTVWWHTSSLVSGFLRSSWAEPPASGSRGWCDWNLAGASRNVAETRTWETKHCYAQCPNPREGREKAAKAMQLTKREVWVRAPAVSNAVVRGQRAPSPSCYTNL